MSKTVGNYFHQPVSKARRSVLQTQVCKYQGSVVPGSVILDETRNFHNLVKHMRSGVEFYLSSLMSGGQERIFISPQNETYNWEFYCSGPINGNKSRIFLISSPLI